jgi:hypothetical protein
LAARQKCFMKGVGGKVCSVWPGDGTKFIDAYLPKNSRVLKGFKHRPKQAGGKVDSSGHSVAKFDLELIVWLHLNSCDFAHRVFLWCAHSNGAIDLSGA